MVNEKERPAQVRAQEKEKGGRKSRPARIEGRGGGRYSKRVVGYEEGKKTKKRQPGRRKSCLCKWGKRKQPRGGKKKRVGHPGGEKAFPRKKGGPGPFPEKTGSPRGETSPKKRTGTGSKRGEMIQQTCTSSGRPGRRKKKIVNQRFPPLKPLPKKKKKLGKKRRPHFPGSGPPLTKKKTRGGRPGHRREKKKFRPTSWELARGTCMGRDKKKKNERREGDRVDLGATIKRTRASVNNGRCAFREEGDLHRKKNQSDPNINPARGGRTPEGDRKKSRGFERGGRHARSGFSVERRKADARRENPKKKKRGGQPISLERKITY